MTNIENRTSKDLDQLKFDNDVRKSRMEFYKYLGSLNTAMIVIVGTLYEIIYPVTDFFVYVLTVLSLICYLFSLIATIRGMLSSMPLHEEEAKKASKAEISFSQGFFAGISGAAFVFGVVFFVSAILISNLFSWIN